MNESTANRARSSSLLRLTVTALVLLAMAVFPVLHGLSWWHDKELKLETGSNRYLNHRLFEGLETFEYGIAPVAPVIGEVENPVWTDKDLLAALPACAHDWDDAPGAVARWRAGLLGSKLREETTAMRMAEQLNALETYLARQSKSSNRKAASAIGLDRSRWLEAIRTSLSRPLVPDHQHPETRLAMRCNDFRDALRVLVPTDCRQALLPASKADESPDRQALVQRQCRALENLSWRSTTPPGEVCGWSGNADQCARLPWHPKLPEPEAGTWRREQIVAIPRRLIEQRDPWRGAPGCIYWAAPQPGKNHYLSDARKSNQAICENPQVSGFGHTEKTAPNAPKQHLLPVSGSLERAAPNDPAWSVPPSLALMLRPLETLRQPGGTLYQEFTRQENRDPKSPTRNATGPNRANINGTDIDIGFSVDLTIDARSQTIAQQVAACYTGNQKICRALNLRRNEDGKQEIGHKLLENAQVRVAGIALIDIASGRIEALAGALSPCARQDFDGPGRGAECDARLPWLPSYRPDSLENPAVFLDAMPASTVKPIMAAAFLGDGAYGAKLLALETAAAKRNAPPAAGELRRQLAHSDSHTFLDRMFCHENGYADCRRPWVIQNTADAFGWNADCQPGSANCGKHDLLFGRAPEEVAENGIVVPLGRQVIYGRFMTEPSEKGDPRFREIAPMEFDKEQVKLCADGQDKKHGRVGKDIDDWERPKQGKASVCRGESLVSLVAEGWGQGNARVTPFGVAGMMAALGAAANGQKEIKPPHLVDGVRDANNRQVLLAHQRYGLDKPHPVEISSESAQVVVNALSWGHRSGGTSETACQEVFSKKACAGIQWIAGKTGTPTFRNDKKPLKELAKTCTEKAIRQGAPDCIELRPYKWYTAVYRSNPQHKTRDKAIAVLTERNWLKDQFGGTVHGPGDHGPNPSAEIALQIAGRLNGQIANGK